MINWIQKIYGGKERAETMGLFVNPDNSAFQAALNARIYVDKSELIGYTNRVLGSTEAFICNSRPRRFGKSTTADMLTAYYSRGCSSEEMFADLKIGQMRDIPNYRNQYDVIHFDVQWCMEPAGGPEHVLAFLVSNIIQELRDWYPQVLPENISSLPEALSRINAATKRQFVVIIDEWDVLIRDGAANLKVQEEYIDFLRGLFKGTLPMRYIALAYLTGILPIKKFKTQSALNNFDEFTMLSSGEFAPYIGFTEEEVRHLCGEYHRDFEEVRRWYDGYLLEGQPVYNPKAVFSVMTRGSFKSYWSETGTYEAIVPLINMDFDGLKTAIIEMLSGTAVPVDIASFQNDTVSFANKDDVLTYLIHLGYLGYDQKSQTAFVPNEEIRQELSGAVRRKSWDEMTEFLRESESLLEATLDGDSDAVAQGIESVHMDYASVIRYHDENSLSSVLTIAYLSSMKYCFKPVREFPTGRGFVDFVYLPKPEYRNEYPALVVELKWKQDADAAIRQIRDRNYPASLVPYTGNILLVGIRYDKKTKEHQCRIETLVKQEAD